MNAAKLASSNDDFLQLPGINNSKTHLFVTLWHFQRFDLFIYPNDCCYTFLTGLDFPIHLISTKMYYENNVHLKHNYRANKWLKCRCVQVVKIINIS